MHKTITQLAKEIGVTKQAIWYKTKSKKLAPSLKGHIKAIGNTFYIDETGEKIIKDTFDLLIISQDGNKKNVKGNQETSNDLTSKNIKEDKTQTDFNVNNQMIDILNQQITILNQQNKELHEELKSQRQYICEMADKLAEIANNAQKLHAGDILLPKLNKTDEQKPLTPKRHMFSFLFKRNPSTNEK